MSKIPVAIQKVVVSVSILIVAAILGTGWGLFLNTVLEASGLIVFVIVSSITIFFLPTAFSSLRHREWQEVLDRRNYQWGLLFLIAFGLWCLMCWNNEREYAIQGATFIILLLSAELPK